MELSTPVSTEELSFEAALRELEGVVATLENGQTPLEESLHLLQRGLELATRCEGVLQQAELTLEKLVMTDDGELVTQEMDE